MKCVCIHGHFYQPPREDPYTEIIHKQSSAYPFTDWNEAVSFQCYGPNAFSRLLNDQGKIINIVNNYNHISFNFGPTLLAWMIKKARTVYKEVIAADKVSVHLFDGHGSAVAQVYNHIIMPLATRRDKEVQVKWGIADFEFHYGRKPEGMWLAETAVDTETLEVLAENDIKFTILSPYQAKAVRYENDADFRPISKEYLNTHLPYKVMLPSGKSIAIFFYDGDFAHQLSFGNLLGNGDHFYQQICRQFDFQNPKPELFNVALDGETFGHHHRNGDMALAYCLDKILNSKELRLVNYGQFLELYPPTTLVQIHEATAWSCAHGVERWNSNCGCKTGGDPAWNQLWRTPLRQALNFLNEKTHAFFMEEAAKYMEDPTQALHEYIQVILHRSKPVTVQFFSMHCKREIQNLELQRLARLFEMKRNAQLMFTSCGWFFTEISGIETVQILMYADRVLTLYETLSEDGLSVKEFLSILKQAKSNIADYKDGEHIYKMWVRPKRQSLSQTAMIQALYQVNKDELFSELDARSSLMEVGHTRRYELGYQRTLTGYYELVSKVTFSQRYFYFTVLQLSRANFIGYFTMSAEAIPKLEKGFNFDLHSEMHNPGQILESLKKMYKTPFSIFNLLDEDQVLILESIANKERGIVDQQLEDIYLRNYPLCVQYKQANKKTPFFLYNIITAYLISKLKRELAFSTFKADNLEKTINDIRQWSVDISGEGEGIRLLLSYLISRLVRRAWSEAKKSAGTVTYATKLEDVVRVFKMMLPFGFTVDLWYSQNTFLDILTTQKTPIKERLAVDSAFKETIQQTAHFLNIDFAYVLQH